MKIKSGRERLWLSVALWAFVAAVGCSEEEGDAAGSQDLAVVGDSGGLHDGGAAGDGEVAPDAAPSEPDAEGPALRCEAVAAPCAAEQMLDLELRDLVGDRAVENLAEAEGFTTVIDASAGVAAGSLAPPSESFVYLRFSEAGLQRLALSDQAAFESQDWDIAVRRYLVRLNSGVSGPSCVEGARMPARFTFDELATLPEGASFHQERYMTESCELVPDGSGLGSANTVLSSFWRYQGCLQMTGNVYVLRLASGQLVKLRVDGYYAQENQAQCDAQGSPGSPSNAGEVRLRWAFLPEE